MSSKQPNSTEGRITIVEADRPEEDTPETWRKALSNSLDARRRFQFDAGEFVECDACAAKPGSPVLCAGCLANRNTIGRLTKAL